MGVTGLWQLIESVGTPVKVDKLEGRRLGVDANIWLYKFIRGFRERENLTNLDAHKLGLFNRICKLLFYKIKPVFVFDGPAPQLKRRTLERRQNVRNKHLEKVQDAAMRLLADQLKGKYPEMNLSKVMIKLPQLKSNHLVAAEKFTNEDRELFYLPPKPEGQEEEEEDENSDYSDTEEVQYLIKDPSILDARRIDIESQEFSKLPPEIRYETLQDVKESRRKIRRVDRLPDDAASFSSFQMERLRSRRCVQEKIEQCEREIQRSYGADAHGQVYVSNKPKEEPKPPQFLRDEVRTLSKKPEDTSPSVKEEEPKPSYPLAEKLRTPNSKISTLIPVAKPHLPSSLKDNQQSKDKYTEVANLSPQSEQEDDCVIEEVSQPVVQDSSFGQPQEVVHLSPSTSSCSSSTVIDEPSANVLDQVSSDEDEVLHDDAPKQVEEPKPKQPVEKVVQQPDDVVVIDDAGETEDEEEEEEEFEEVVEDEDDDDCFIQVSPESAPTASVSASTASVSSDAAPRAPEPKPTTTAPVTASEPEVEKEVQREVHVNVGEEMERRDRSEQSTRKVTSKIIEEAKELLRLFGVPFIVAGGEAEAQCAVLEKLKLTEGTITDDSDIWLFGARNVYRHFFNDKKNQAQLYKMADIEAYARLSREKMICLAMLVGSDYTDGVMNVGPVTGMKILDEFPGENLEPLIRFKEWRDEYAAAEDKKVGNQVRKSLLKYQLPESFPSQTVFDAYLNPAADSSSEKFTWGVPDLDELREYVRRNFGWSLQKADDTLKPVIKRVNESRRQLVLQRTA